MAKGTDTYESLAVPLQPAGGFEIKQQTASAATDVLTITAASSGTGAFIVCANSAGTTLFSVDSGGALVVKGAAGTVLIKATQAASPTVDAVQVLDSNASKVFQVDSTGQIRTMILGTYALASLASAASLAIAVTGATTDDVALLLPTKTPAVSNGWVNAFCSSGSVIVFATGAATVAANTVAIWLFRPIKN